MGRGKAKGSDFEREVIRDIIAAFNVTPQEATRSILSGGHKDAFGDITMSAALTKKFPFAIECKSWKKGVLYDLVKPWETMPKSKGSFRSWWTQTITDARRCRRAPLLVFKANNQPVLCALLYSELRKDVRKQLMWGPYLISFAPGKPRGSLHRIIIVCWDDFLKQYVEKVRSNAGRRSKANH